MAVHDFGPHGEKSRVIWHSGTVQPFSSLWIILQRFLLLNRPTQSAFTHDFFEKKSIQHFGKISLNSNGTNREAPPLRLVRLARVLHESPKRFERSLIGQYPHTLWPLFREFAICPSCLKEGFHSVLFSLDGLTHCPIHLDKLTPYACCEKKKFIHSLQNIDFSTPGQCECGKRFLGYREAREPATNLGRDEALADVTQWLELIGSRCFLGLRHYLSSDSQIDRFTQHVSRLTEPLQLSAPPQWWPPNFNLPHAFLPKMTPYIPF